MIDFSNCTIGSDNNQTLKKRINFFLTFLSNKKHKEKCKP